MSALDDVRRRYEALPARVHTDDPRTVLARITSGTFAHTITHDEAVQLAALGLALVVAVDRAEMMRVDTGSAA